MKELAADGIPVAVTCRVLKLSRQPYYRWLADPITEAELIEAYRANALFDAHADDPEFGYRYLVEAKVENGRQLGRTIGYPTANMALPAETALREGIYAVRLRRADGTLHDGVASYGRRPTVTENGAPLLESHVFDASPDLYGETCSVSFFGWLRGEEKFDGLDPLVAQMKRDEAEARTLLADVKPLSVLDAVLNFA